MERIISNTPLGLEARRIVMDWLRLWLWLWGAQGRPNKKCWRFGVPPRARKSTTRAPKRPPRAPRTMPREPQNTVKGIFRSQILIFQKSSLKNQIWRTWFFGLFQTWILLVTQVSKIKFVQPDFSKIKCRSIGRQTQKKIFTMISWCLTIPVHYETSWSSK